MPCSKTPAKPTTTTDTDTPLLIKVDVTSYHPVLPAPANCPNIRTYSRVSHFVRAKWLETKYLPKVEFSGDITTMYGDNQFVVNRAIGYACILPGADVQAVACVVPAWETLLPESGPRCELPTESRDRPVGRH